MIDFKKFMMTFPDEKTCRKYLFQLRWPDGFCCPRCGYGYYCYIKTRDLYECLDCRAQSAVTTGTIMHRTKLPLTFWFLTLYWIASGQKCTARKLSQTLHLNYRTALRMLRCIRTAMRKYNFKHPLSELFRNLEVNNNEKPSSVPIESEKALGRPNTEVKREKRHTPSLTQAIYTSIKKIMIGKMENFIRTYYRNVSSAYKQSYLDEFYFRWIQRTNQRNCLSTLLSICSKSRHFSEWSCK